MAALTHKDRQALSNWLRSGASLDEVESVSRTGLVDNERFTEAAVRAYRLLWNWCSYRFGGDAGDAQERYYAKCGREAFERRRKRARQWANKLAGGVVCS